MNKHDHGCDPEGCWPRPDCTCRCHGASWWYRCGTCGTVLLRRRTESEMKRTIDTHREECSG